MKLQPEFLKLKRTLVLPVVLLTPFIPAALVWGIFRRPQEAGASWELFLQQGLVYWALLMLPLVLSLLIAQVTALEHASGGWRLALALPRQRGWLLLEKLVVLLALSLGMHLLALAAALLAGYALPHELTGPLEPGAIVLRYAFSWLASLGMTLLTLWVALRFPSFLAPSGLGAAATVVGFVLINSEYGPFWPWSYPAFAVTEPAQQLQVLVCSLVLAAAMLAVSLIDFGRRDF